MDKIVTKLFIKKTMQYWKNPTYLAGESNFVYTFQNFRLISEDLFELCFQLVKKSGFEKNVFKVLSTVKFAHLDIFSALHLLVYHF